MATKRMPVTVQVPTFLKPEWVDQSTAEWLGDPKHETEGLFNAPWRSGSQVLVPESVLKKRRKLEEIKTAKDAAAAEKATKAAANKDETFKRAEKYIVR